MEQQKSLSALYPFLALSKSATSPRQAADIVTQATSAANTFVFAQLLQTPMIQSLRTDAQHNNSYKLLELFTWGTWAEYTAQRSLLPALSPPQTHKLRLLTLLRLAATTPSATLLTYSTLLTSLGLAASSELESLVTDAIYADLITATLDPANQVVVVSAVAPLRDLAPGAVAPMICELEAWAGRCEAVLVQIEERVEQIKAEAKRREGWEEVIREQRERAEVKWLAVMGHQLGEEQGLGSSSVVGRILGGKEELRSRSGGDNGDAMDVDGVGQMGGPGRSKRSWFGRKK